MLPLLFSLLLLLAATGVSLYAALIIYVRWKYSHLPSPKTTSFFRGHTYELEQFKRRGNGENPLDEQFIQWASEVGNLYVLFYYWNPAVIVLNPTDVETVSALHTKTEIINHFTYLFGERLLGNGLFTLRTFEEWKPRRREYESAFNTCHLKVLFPTFCKSVDLLLGKLAPLADGETKVSLKTYIRNTALDIISKVIFSSDFTIKWTDNNTRTTMSVKDQGIDFLTEQAFKGIEKSRLYPFFKFFHPREAEHYREVARTLRAIGRNCIQNRIKALEDGEEVPLDILSHILKVEAIDQTADIETLVDDFVTFYIGGVETLANTVLFAVVQVHTHPQVLGRLLSEIDEVLGERERVTAEDLDRLKYTEQVIEETMRLPGVVGGFARQCPPGGLTLNGFHIPAGTSLLIHTGAMCKMPQYFDDPNTFNPSRFGPTSKRLSPYVYFPFCVGSRSCIARHFAMMEAKLILSRLVQTFAITLPQGYKLDIVERTTKYPRDEVMCTLLSRYH